MRCPVRVLSTECMNTEILYLNLVSHRRQNLNINLHVLQSTKIIILDNNLNLAELHLYSL